MENIIIIGSGPAGLTSAIYTSRANLSPIVIEGLQSGGQLMTTTEVENFPGFSEGIMGPDLIMEMRKQAERFGTKFVNGNVIETDFSRKPFKIKTEGNEYLTKSVIIATGATPRKLNIESETRLWGRGVSSCATCDGAFFRGQEVCVIGGGDSAIEEALFLTRFASKVSIIHRRNELRASKIMQDRVLNHDKIEVLWDSVVEEILGDEKQKVRGVMLKNVKNGNLTEYPCTGFFLGIGHIPNTQIFTGQLEMENGYIVTKGQSSHTNVEGIFAAGDMSDHTYNQAITAAAMGCKAAIDVERYLTELNI